MKTVVLALFLSFLPLSADGQTSTSPPITAEAVAGGWIALFDGRSTFGWQGVAENWHINEGVLKSASEPTGELITTTDFADFELRLEINAAANSTGTIVLRSSTLGHGPIVELSSAAKTLEKSTASSRVPLPKDKWCRLNVTLRGNQVTVNLDDQKIEVGTIGNSSATGKIALNVATGQIKFRNVWLKPLQMKPLFNGKDLAGWTDKNANKSRYEVTPTGEIRVIGGEGQLETLRNYTNFILQLDCFVKNEGINSGVFFRAISGKFRKIKGYESQIYNRLDPNSPNTPQKYGTGGIYLHQIAREQRAHDQEWFTKTIAVTGPHMAVWVNGIQVSDWTDDRPLNDNPRLGTCLKPGVICLQAHDPTTDVLFKNLQLAELPSSISKQSSATESF